MNKVPGKLHLNQLIICLLNNQLLESFSLSDTFQKANLRQLTDKDPEGLN